MDERRPPARRPSDVVQWAIGLAWLVGGLACFAAPPPPATERPRVAHATRARLASTAAAPAAGDRDEGRCDRVRRAQRTWVEFAPGMSLDDMVPAGIAAARAVRALDRAVCALGRGEKVPELEAQRARLADAGPQLEVTKVLWQDVELTRAELELQPARGRGWQASLVRDGEIWRVRSLTSL